MPPSALVAVVVVRVALDPVGAALERHVDGRAGGVSLLGVEGRGLDLELLHRAGGRDERHAAAVGHVRRAVERELVAARAAVGGEVGRAAVVERTGELEVAVIGDAGGQPREHERVAVRERHQRDALLVDDLPGRSAARVEKRRFRRDVDHLGQPAHFHLEIDLQPIADPDFDVLPVQLLEALQLCADAIGSRRQIQQRVVARPVGDGLVAHVGITVGHRDRHAWQQATRFVGHPADDSAAKVLRPRKRWRRTRA